ncbi:RCC1/BLIP-II protein [Acrodontium crateriforme]|uniref:RCC1/BLIP-II protein n=1 Tax=Acrodontium crateriforme TaxID=150365 RepID=A0AAQ3M211_9PEZI|nr:RCC1/BLIP-II protein [Acrodontium crateriforme]
MAPKKPVAKKADPKKSASVKANTKVKVTKPEPEKAKKPKADGARASSRQATNDSAAPKKATKATATTTSKAKPAPQKSLKRKSSDDDEKPAPAKKAKVVKMPKAAPKPKPAPKPKKIPVSRKPAVAPVKPETLTKGPVINEPPTQRMNIYVHGEGTAGELGLGTAARAVDVKRPRLNPNLTADTAGVVQISAGGMHVLALTHDNKILSWGVNDSGALGRDTTWEGGLKDADEATKENEDEGDDESVDSDDDNGLNPRECIPAEVDWSETPLPEGTRFVQVAAGDSCSFALTDDGRVYGWGSFRGTEGPFAFDPETPTAFRPKLVPALKKITSIKAGANHAIALDKSGTVFAWGSGEQHQLGRKVVERKKKDGLLPRTFGLPKGPKNGIKSIETGEYHSMAISKNGDVYAWGLNNFGQTGIPDNAGTDDAVVTKPKVIEHLRGKTITSLTGGGHHSIAATSEGECLIWGHADCQIGIPAEVIEKLPEDAIVRDEKGRAGIVMIPQKVPGIEGTVIKVSAAGETNGVITAEGKAWTWGFSTNYQTGTGADDDVKVATMIDNTAVRDVKITGIGIGGQYGILTSFA